MTGYVVDIGLWLIVSWQMHDESLSRQSSLSTSMPTPAQAQAQAAPAQAAEETTFQKFAKVAQVHRHSIPSASWFVANFLQQILFAYLLSLLGMIAFPIVNS